MTASGHAPVPVLVRMAAHPLRWALMSELASSDRRVHELVAALDEPQNLVSYHLRLLRDAGLVSARPSSADGRFSYYRLDLARCASALADAGSALHPALTMAPKRAAWPRGASVLFLCTGNSARSPMAEALLRRRAEGVQVASAGSHPAPSLHPNALRVLREDFGINLEPRRPQSLDSLAGRRFDCVITLCDRVREVSRHQGSAVTAHWSVPDPSAAGDGDRASYPAFRRVAMELDSRIAYLLPRTRGAASGAESERSDHSQGDLP